MGGSKDLNQFLGNEEKWQSLCTWELERETMFFEDTKGRQVHTK